MKLYLKLLFISMISFIYAECSEIDNQDDCERFEWCEWIESDNVPNGGVCTGEWEDDEDGEDDEEEFEGCSEIDNQEECDRVEGCEWSDNAGCIEGEWEDDEEEWEECSEIDNQEECDRVEGCEWSDNAGCIEGEWEDDEDGEDEEELSCEELNYQLECEATSECEWVDGSCQSKDDIGGSLDNGQDITYSLLKNYPNPFNPSTNISFTITNPSQVSLKIYDLSGKEVSQLINDFYMSGNYNIQWDAKDIYGNQLSSGIYIYRLSTQYGILSNTMMLIR